MLKLRALSWGDHPGLSGWAHYNHKGPYKRETGGVKVRRRHGNGTKGWVDVF